jgi:hypothetical protein
MTDADLFSDGVQRLQSERIFKHDQPGFHRLMGVGGKLLGIVRKLSPARFALKALLPSKKTLSDEPSVLISAARTAFRLNISKLLI